MAVLAVDFALGLKFSSWWNLQWVSWKREKVNIAVMKQRR